MNAFGTRGSFVCLRLACAMWMFGIAPMTSGTAGRDLRADEVTVIESARTGPWSSPSTWKGNRVPGAGSRVWIRDGHTVTYDVASDDVIRTINVAGVLTFSREKDTRLCVGLLKIQAGDVFSEDGFDCEAHLEEIADEAPRPALEVGTPRSPIPAGIRAVIRLTYVPGMDEQSCPAIMCCGGRMDFHGAPLSHSWVKLGETAAAGTTTVTLSEPVTGWKTGDLVIITAANGQRDYGEDYRTEERTIRRLEGNQLHLDRPLEFEHLGTAPYRGEVAVLSRNVVVESADPEGVRGHTMYHRGSKGAISYTEFRHLGKKNTLGRYSLHFHLVGDTMRGSYVIGNAIHDSHNRWLTIHGTNYLVVRDNVGYRSVGHGFFLEDGTEVYNVLDRNLAVQALRGKRLPKQVLPFDQNEGAGFWWANSLNTFVHNVAVECDQYGYRYEATPTSALKLEFRVLMPDGERRMVDIRTLPFVRFEDNEAHSIKGLYGFNLGEGVNRVGPDERHPFIVRRFLAWDVHYAFRPQVPSLLCEHLHIHRAAYGIYHPNYDHHVYRDVLISRTDAEPFNRGHDDLSVQYGPATVDGLTFRDIRLYSMPLIQITEDNPTGEAVMHIRGFAAENCRGGKEGAYVNRGGGPRPTPKTPHGVPIFLHDYFGPGRTAKVVSTRANDFGQDGLSYRSEPPLTGNESRVAEVSDVEFPELLFPVDDMPPVTVITFCQTSGGKTIVRGTTSDNGVVRRVTVNGQPATETAPNFAQWTITLEGQPERVEACAEDGAGNREVGCHVVRVEG